MSYFSLFGDVGDDGDESRGRARGSSPVSGGLGDTASHAPPRRPPGRPAPWAGPRSRRRWRRSSRQSARAARSRGSAGPRRDRAAPADCRRTLQSARTPRGVSAPVGATPAYAEGALRRPPPSLRSRADGRAARGRGLHADAAGAKVTASTTAPASPTTGCAARASGSTGWPAAASRPRRERRTQQPTPRSRAGPGGGGRIGTRAALSREQMPTRTVSPLVARVRGMCAP